MHDLLYRKLVKKNLSYQQLEEINDNERILVNVNVLLYLLSFYVRNKNENKNTCLEIIYKYLDKFEERLKYIPILVKDAKIIFKPWEKDKTITNMPFAVLKDNNLSSELTKTIKLQIELLRNIYDEALEKYEETFTQDTEDNNKKYNDLDTFFEITNERVITNLLFKIQEKFREMIDKNNFEDITISMPIIIKENLQNDEKEHLLILYLDKLSELDMGDLGLIEIAIKKEKNNNKPFQSEMLFESNIHTDQSIYVLKLRFSISKKYIERKYQREHDRQYIRMIKK